MSLELIIFADSDSVELSWSEMPDRFDILLKVTYFDMSCTSWHDFSTERDEISALLKVI